MSDLERQIEELDRSGGFPTQAIYEELLYTTQSIVSVAVNMTEAIKRMAENLNLPEPGPLAGAARKVNLGLPHAQKDEIARRALISARQILGSNDRLIDSLAAEVADILDDTSDS